MQRFKLSSNYEPQGDQPQAIRELSEGIGNGLTHQTLLGVTGSGKTFTMANVIKHVNLPTLIICSKSVSASSAWNDALI